MKKSTTETEFINWLEEFKGIVIDRKMQFSTYGSLGKSYKTKEGVDLFYGLSVKGLPPHLDLRFISLMATKPQKLNYSDIQKSFYSNAYSNNERYKMLIKQLF